MMAIYKGVLAYVTDDDGQGVILDGELHVNYGDIGLVIDPTDAQIVAARNGDPIPLDSEERGEIETIMRAMPGVPEGTIRAALSRWVEERPKAIQRRS